MLLPGLQAKSLSVMCWCAVLLPKNGVAVSVDEQVLVDNQVADVGYEHLVGDLVGPRVLGFTDPSATKPIMCLETSGDTSMSNSTSARERRPLVRLGAGQLISMRDFGGNSPVGPLICVPLWHAV